MKFTRDEYTGMGVSVIVALIFFTGLRLDLFSFFGSQGTPDKVPASDIVTLDTNAGADEAAQALRGVLTNKGAVTKLIIEDTRVGTGTPVVNGSKVTVNYLGMLQDGTTFDSSYTKGVPFSFVVGAGSVIKGWDKGLVGMKVGGERILVIPSDLAYGNRIVGPVPANATLLFSVELLSVE